MTEEYYIRLFTCLMTGWWILPYTAVAFLCTTLTRRCGGWLCGPCSVAWCWRSSMRSLPDWRKPLWYHPPLNSCIHLCVTFVGITLDLFSFRVSYHGLLDSCVLCVSVKYISHISLFYQIIAHVVLFNVLYSICLIVAPLRRDLQRSRCESAGSACDT